MLCTLWKLWDAVGRLAEVEGIVPTNPGSSRRSPYGRDPVAWKAGDICAIPRRMKDGCSVACVAGLRGRPGCAVSPARFAWLRRPASCRSDATGPKTGCLGDARDCRDCLPCSACSACMDCKACLPCTGCTGCMDCTGCMGCMGCNGWRS